MLKIMMIITMTILIKIAKMIKIIKMIKTTKMIKKKMKQIMTKKLKIITMVIMKH